MKFSKFKLNKDYIQSYPYGVFAEPQLSVISGDYKGLVIDIQSSGVTINKNDNNIESNMNYTFKILQTWNKISKNQVDGTSIKLTPTDQKYIHDLIYNFIKNNKIVNG